MMGMLLDPLADKLMVSAALIVLVAYNPRVVPAWIVVLAIGREFLVSGLRSIAATEGFTIEASGIGKFKTVIQIVLDRRGHSCAPLELLELVSLIWGAAILSESTSSR